MITALFAVDDNNGMGYRGAIPWPKNKDDMKWFKSTTTNHIVIMGKNTWDSNMPTPLPNRYNAVITHSTIPTIHTISNNIIEGCLTLSKTYPDKHIYIIGGPNIIMQLHPIIDSILLTRIPGIYPCDTYIDLPSLLLNFIQTTTTHYPTCTIEHYERISRKT